jgi:serine/threonine-protein kinase
MPDDTRILELVEEILNSQLTAEEVCAQSPELLEDVKACLEECRQVNLQIADLFPSGPAVTTPTAWPPSTSGLSPSPPVGERLPLIPGYAVLGVVGRGGMGVIYRARHLRLNRVVALKMLLSGEFASRTELTRFQREAEAIAALQHSNIVQIYDVGEIDGRAYFTMEFVVGGTLAQKLSGVPQPAQYSARVTETLSRATHAAHVAGIVHRDIKPANVLLANDGTPKITDFGLARHFERPADVTLVAAKVGTPSYMAPEQVIGKQDTLGPAADVYALGATLYELLTGRPPFRGETVTETERQVVNEEPAAPSRLNAKVPRDLETICLKCLRKEPEARYATALDLADDLRRFSEGRPILARPVGWPERSWRWAKRNPTAVALLLTVLALVGLASGGGVWLVHQRAEGRAETAHQSVESREVIRATVTQAERLRKAFQFREARAVLERVRGPLEGGWRSLHPEVRDGLKRQIQQAGANVDLAERLNTARSQAASILEGRTHPATAEPLYISAFAESGLGPEREPSEAVAAAVHASPIREELVAALDDWASITPDAERRAWLLAVARGADPGPPKDRLRQPELWRDGDKLARLIEDPGAAAVSPQLAAALARVARTHHKNALPMLMATQARFPQDFGVNYELGYALCREGRGLEGLGYFRAALAIRPAAVSHNGVGFALVSLGRLDEALGHFQEAVRLDPGYAAAQFDLADVLQKKGRLDEAVVHFRKALGIDPNLAAAHVGLGSLACAQGRIDDAFEEFQQAVRIDPADAMAHDGLGFVLRTKGLIDEAIREGQEAVRIDPNLADAHSSLGYSLVLKGRVDEAIEHYRRAIAIDSKVDKFHHNLGGALARKGLLDEAIEQYQQALELNPNLAPAHANLGSVLGAKGRLDDAIAQYTEAIRLNPKDAAAHISLAKILLDKGRLDDAIDHVMEGGRIDPKLAVYQDKLGNELYSSACARIHSILNPEAQITPLAEPERTKLRRQALELLQADLRLTREILKAHRIAARPLTAWQADPALASVRDTSELTKLPDAEREQWQRFWADVAREVVSAPTVPEGP